ncbi:Hypothetical protein, partial CDS, partial [Neorhizobium galegae bv. officinalis]
LPGPYEYHDIACRAPLSIKITQMIIHSSAIAADWLQTNRSNSTTFLSLRSRTTSGKAENNNLHSMKPFHLTAASRSIDGKIVMCTCQQTAGWLEREKRSSHLFCGQYCVGMGWGSRSCEPARDLSFAVGQRQLAVRVTLLSFTCGSLSFPSAASGHAASPSLNRPVKKAPCTIMVALFTSLVLP